MVGGHWEGEGVVAAWEEARERRERSSRREMGEVLGEVDNENFLGFLALEGVTGLLVVNVARIAKDPGGPGKDDARLAEASMVIMFFRQENHLVPSFTSDGVETIVPQLPPVAVTPSHIPFPLHARRVASAKISG